MPNPLNKYHIFYFLQGIYSIYGIRKIRLCYAFQGDNPPCADAVKLGRQQTF
jgi:hypothetical protein